MNFTVKVFADENFAIFDEKTFEAAVDAYNYGWSIQDTLEGKIWAIYNPDGKCIHSSDVALVDPEFKKPIEE